MIQVMQLAWLAVILVWLPVQTFRRARHPRALQLSRPRLYVAIVVGQWWLALVTLAVDYASGFPALAKVRVVPPAGAFLGWTLATLAAILALAYLGLVALHRKGRRESPTLSRLLPRTSGERLGFVGVSVTAGVVEEFVYRGFCLAVLSRLLGSTPVALLIVTVSFGFGHAYQTWTGILRTGVIGLIVALPVLVTGSLLPSMVVHAATDVAAGYLLTPLRKRWGLLDDEASSDRPPAAAEPAMDLPPPGAPFPAEPAG